MNKYFKTQFEYAGKTIYIVVYNVGNQQTADAIVKFCLDLAMVAFKVNAQMSEVTKALDNQAKDMGDTKEIAKALYRTYGKCEQLVAHPEWF